MSGHSAPRGHGTGGLRGLWRARILLVPGLALSTGCLYHAREATDDAVRTIASHPVDLLPGQLKKPGAEGAEKGSRNAPPPSPLADFATDVQASAYMAAQEPKQPQPKFQLQVPEVIPGSEVPPITLPADPEGRLAALRKLYAPLPPLPEEVRPLPGPNGQPYTLADLQRIAAENSPTLRQAASDVQAARGNMIQAATYPNPNFSLQTQASNNNSTGGSLGFTVDQVVITGGKLRLQTASAKKDLDNAEVALKRAKSDLATQVRNAYYGLLVAKETMRVTRGLSVLTDEVYRVQLALTEKGGLAAGYEPALLRSQAYTARQAYKQARATYIYAWKQLVAAVNVRQLPLTEVAGRIDAAVPLYEYDKVLALILTTHTDMLTARNGIDKNRYNLKLAQVTPYFPNVDLNAGMYRDRALLPFGTYHTFTATAPIPIWDQNRGNILAAEAALTRAVEEPHRVEMALTTSLAAAYTTYQANLVAIEDYRRYILPDQVRAYRGVLQRRQVDINAQFADLVTAQQLLSTSVTTYLVLLGNLWQSVVSVASLMQTDDLFQTATPELLPELPDLEHLGPLPCCHPFGQTGAGAGAPAPALLPSPLPAPAPAPVGPRLPPPRPLSLGVGPSIFLMFFCNPAAPAALTPAAGDAGRAGPPDIPRVLPAG